MKPFSANRQRHNKTSNHPAESHKSGEARFRVPPRMAILNVGVLCLWLKTFPAPSHPPPPFTVAFAWSNNYTKVYHRTAAAARICSPGRMCLKIPLFTQSDTGPSPTSPNLSKVVAQNLNECKCGSGCNTTNTHSHTQVGSKCSISSFQGGKSFPTHFLAGSFRGCNRQPIFTFTYRITFQVEMVWEEVRFFNPQL